VAIPEQVPDSNPRLSELPLLPACLSCPWQWRCPFMDGSGPVLKEGSRWQICGLQAGSLGPAHQYHKSRVDTRSARDVTHYLPFSAARFLGNEDKDPSSSASSDTEEDSLPANKCKKVRGYAITQV
jgi:hypothetical protein